MLVKTGISGIIIIIGIIPIIVMLWQLWRQVVSHRHHNHSISLIKPTNILSTKDVSQLKRGDLIFSTPLALPSGRICFDLINNRMAISSVITSGKWPIHCGVVIQPGDTIKTVVLLEQNFNTCATSKLEEWIVYAKKVGEVITIAQLNQAVDAETSEAFLNELGIKVQYNGRPTNPIPYYWDAVWQGIMTRYLRPHPTKTSAKSTLSNKPNHFYKGAKSKQHTCCSLVYAYLEYAKKVFSFLPSSATVLTPHLPKWHPFEMHPGDFLMPDFCFAKDVWIETYCILNV